MNFITIGPVQSLFFALLLFILPAFGCYPKTKIPIDTLRYDAPDGDRKVLFVFLPGNGDPPNTFDKKGLLQSLRSRNLPFDAVAVNAHLGYYMDGSIFTRLKEDVIDPARARGYTAIWLIGNSLGGYGSISYARQHPEDVSGVVMLGPYLGDKKIIQEIIDAGGLQFWDPGDIQNNSKENWEKQLWKWVKDGDQQKGFWHWVKNCDEGDQDCPPRIYLGYGKRDRFSAGQKLMAEILPQEHVFSIEGGHDWRTWKKLWNQILDKITSRKRPLADYFPPPKPSRNP